jgi:four helix bundle protein
MQDFRELKIWQKAHCLTLGVYRVTKLFPKEELYGLTSQMRRACVSIPANIVEGRARSGDVEFARFLQIAMGSAHELQYHLLLAFDLTFLKDSEYKNLSTQLTEIQQMLSGFLKKLKAGRTTAIGESEWRKS